MSYSVSCWVSAKGLRLGMFPLSIHRGSNRGYYHAYSGTVSIGGTSQGGFGRRGGGGGGKG